MQVELSDIQVKILLGIIEKTNFSGKSIEVVAKLKLDLQNSLPKTQVKEKGK